MSILPAAPLAGKLKRQQALPSSPADRPEIDAWLRRAEWLMNYLLYDPAEVGDALRYLRRMGSAAGCSVIAEQDRQPIDDLLA